MTEPIVLDNIPFEIDLDRLAQELHVKEGSQHFQEVSQLAAAAQAIARPKAVYKAAFIESRGEDSVIIDSVTFHSRILRVNLEKAHRVFPYVATCGIELEEWANSLGDMLHRYWAEAIKVMALRAASKALYEDLMQRFQPGKTSSMNPGSLGDWPLHEQRPLFALLDNPTKWIGVRLTDSLLMIPTKSVSGIRFPVEESFESCQLCPRENCPGRRAPYDKSLYERKYQKAGRNEGKRDN